MAAKKRSRRPPAPAKTIRVAKRAEPQPPPGQGRRNSGARVDTILPAIVAVGASAGGLDAFTELISLLPKDLGMALVMMQHLQSSGHPSLLPHLLQKATTLPVREISDGTVPEANHIYVMPANKNVVLERGQLRLRERASRANEPNLPIDLFMRSLAEGRGSGAIGVVLSGTADDGTQGLLAIKHAGGICFAQSEDSAEYAAMPRSAIASGCVDFALPPGEIARELTRMAHHPYLAAVAHADPDTPPPLVSERDRAYSGILELVRHETGVDFSQYRASTIGRRLARRMALHARSSVADYLTFLRTHPQEIGLLLEDLLIPATRFFRDPEVFEYLKKHILTILVKERRPATRALRFWSVGCSSGEEAYTLAMIGLEVLAAHGESGNLLQVFGTDLNESAVRRARAGRYSAEISRDIGAARLQRFFVKTEQGYRVAKALRDVCIFAQHNIAREAPFSHLDVICCRNVMIYMEPPLQRRIFPILHYALNAGGTLALGSAESASSMPEMFRAIGHGTAQRKLKLFASQASGQAPHFDLPSSRGFGAHGPAATPVAAKAGLPGEEARREADRLILSDYAPAGVVINADMEVLEFRGRTSPYLEPAPGAASLNLMKMARGNLGAYVRSALGRAQKTGAVVHQPGLLASLAGGEEDGEREIDLHVIPLKAAGARAEASPNRGLYLVLFHLAAAGVAGGRGSGKTVASQREMERLRRSLAECQKLIRSLSDEYQASKQEYQAASEEIASANEELQSSNEELETSKEELQSANEEISTINEELRHRNSELHQSNADLQNLIGVASFAVVLLDRELRIRRFSPAAEKIFSLIPADVGRRIGDLRSSIAVADVEALALGAFATSTGQRREVQDAEGRWHELRVNPYFTTERQIDGVVLAVADIDAVRRLSFDLAEAISRAASNPMALLDPQFNLVRSNQRFRQLTGIEATGDRWQPAALRAAVETSSNGTPAEFHLDLGGRAARGRVERLPSREGETLLLVSFE